MVPIEGAPLTWAQRLRRVFDLDISRCPRCDAALRVLAAIMQPRVVAAILAHLEDASFDDAMRVAPQLQTRFCFAAVLRALGLHDEAAEIEEEIHQICSSLSEVLDIAAGSALVRQRIDA